MPNVEDYDLVVMLSGGCSLDSSPGKNWVENSGGLPNYICKIARAVMKSGKSKSSSIAIAVSRVKKWAAGGDGVDADTKAKAAAAVTAWEKLKAKAKADNYVKATSPSGQDFLMFSNTSYNLDKVRGAWDAIERDRRKAERAGRTYGDGSEIDYNYRYVREVWSDFLLISNESSKKADYVKVPYSVNALTGDITFGDEVAVKQIYVEVDDDLSEAEMALLSEYV